MPRPSPFAAACLLLLCRALPAAEVVVPEKVAKAEASYVAEIEELRAEFADEAAEARDDLIAVIEREKKKAARSGDMNLANALQDRVNELRELEPEGAPMIDISGVATAVDERQRAAMLLGDAKALAAHRSKHAAAIARFELAINIALGPDGREDSWLFHPAAAAVEEHLQRYITDAGLGFTWDEALRADVAKRAGCEPDEIATMVLKYRIDGGEQQSKGWKGSQIGQRISFPLPPLD